MGNLHSYEVEMVTFQKKALYYQDLSEEKTKIINKQNKDIKIMQNEIDILAKCNKDLQFQLIKIHDDYKKNYI